MSRSSVGNRARSAGQEVTARRAVLPVAAIVLIAANSAVIGYLVGQTLRQGDRPAPQLLDVAPAYAAGEMTGHRSGRAAGLRTGRERGYARGFEVGEREGRRLALAAYRQGRRGYRRIYQRGRSAGVQAVLGGFDSWQPGRIYLVQLANGYAIARRAGPLRPGSSYRLAELGASSPRPLR